MKSKRIYYAMIGLIILLSLTAVGVVYFGNNLLKTNAAKLNDLKLEEKVLQEQRSSIEKAKRDLDKYQDLEQELKAIVPQDKDQARAVREVIKIAKESGINIRSISFPSSGLGASTKQSSENQNPDAPDSSKDTSSSKKPPVTQAEPVSDVPGVYSLEMAIIPEEGSAGAVKYSSFLNFLEKMEKNRRTAQVTTISITPVESDGGTFITFTLSINIFLKP